MNKLAVVMGVLGAIACGGAAVACCSNYAEYAEACRANGGTPHSSPSRCDFSSAPAVDPRIAQAYALNEAGRAAMAAKDYDRADDLFTQAFNTYPQAVYNDNRALALASKHLSLGNAAYERRQWAAAVAEYRRALAFHPMDAADENIRAALSNENLDGADLALRQRQFDQAILLYQEANRWRPDPRIDELIRRARVSKLIAQGNAAFHERRFADAEAFYAQAMQLNPNSAVAANNHVLAIWQQADEKAGTGDLEAAIAAFDRTLAAYAASASVAGSDSGYRGSWEAARADARARLTALARSDADWERITAVHERWYRQSGQDKAAERELANVRAAQAGQAVRQSRSTGDIAKAISKYDRALADDPDNERARAGKTKAVRDLAAAQSTHAAIHDITGSARNVNQALEQAKAAAAAGEASGACFDGTASCGKAPDSVLPVVATPTPVSPFMAPDEETQDMKALRTKIQALAQDHVALQAELKQETDPMKRYEDKNDLALNEVEAYTKQMQYDDQKKARVQELAAHRIAPKHGASSDGGAGTATPSSGQ